MELTRFRRHLNVSFRGVYDVQEGGPVHPGVEAADSLLHSSRTAASLSKEFGPTAWSICLWDKQVDVKAAKVMVD